MMGINKAELQTILMITQKYAADCKVYAFGSRAKNTAKKHSDLDLFFEAKNGQKQGFLKIQKIKEAFQESDLPYRVDVVDYNDISDNFRQITEKEKLLIYG